MKMKLQCSKAEIEDAVRTQIQKRLNLDPDKVGKATLSRGRSGDEMTAEVEVEMPDAPPVAV